MAEIQGVDMMEEELRQFLKELGWNLLLRYRQERRYFYAQKWRKGEVYITSETNLPTLQKEDVLKKIADYLAG